MLLTVLQLTWVALAYLSGYLYDRYRATWLVPLGMALIALGLLGWGLFAPFGYGVDHGRGDRHGRRHRPVHDRQQYAGDRTTPREQARARVGPCSETTRQLGHTLGRGHRRGTMMGAAVADALSGIGSAARLPRRASSRSAWRWPRVCGIGLGLSLLPLLPRGPAAPRPAATAAPMAGGAQ